jgi:hypothetical protein
MVGEYMDRYKHHPTTVPELTWHEFAFHVDRTGQYQVRDRLIFADAATLGAPAHDGADLALRAMEKHRLERIAWPGKRG